jgi:hypothetical protein
LSIPRARLPKNCRPLRFLVFLRKNEYIGKETLLQDKTPAFLFNRFPGSSLKKRSDLVILFFTSKIMILQKIEYRRQNTKIHQILKLARRANTRQ